MQRMKVVYMGITPVFVQCGATPSSWAVRGRGGTTGVYSCAITSIHYTRASSAGR